MDERERIDARLRDCILELGGHHDGIALAMNYAVFNGGKRIRPLLVLSMYDRLGGTRRDGTVLDAAAAIECVHTYSLVHDDLPCMDDDDFRRGRPSTHRKFGEATAVLTGDALLTLAFEIIATTGSRHPETPAGLALDALRTLAAACGTGGLITGQALDLDGSGGDIALVERVHDHKTARLIAAALELGAICAGAEGDVCERARTSGMLAGRAFQIVDDILDIVAGKETLGKTPGKDVKSGKLTYPGIVGVDASRREARRLIDAAHSTLPGPGGSVDDLLERMIERDN